VHNQAFNADSLQRGILLRKILRPAANHFAGKPAPFCRLTWRYVQLGVNMKLKINLLIACLVPCVAIAAEDANRTVDRVGVQGNNAYFTAKEGFSQNCQWASIYLDISTSFGKAAYSNILAAKTSGKKLSRVAYDQATSGGSCTLSLVEMKD